MVWLFVPYATGIVMSIFVAGLSMQTTEDKILRLVGFLFGWAIGFVIQVNAIGRKFDSVVAKVGNSLGLFGFLFNEGAIYTQVRRIIGRSEHLQRDLEHLSHPQQKLVESWIVTFLNEVDAETAGYAKNVTYFRLDEGMEVDQALVETAQMSIRASTRVSDESIEFWTTQNQGKRYRNACIDKVSQFGEAKFDSNTSELQSGVARIFSFKPKTLEAAANDDPVAKKLVNATLEEAVVQRKSGLAVRILHHSDIHVQNKETARLDLLVVDSTISSKTKDVESNGVARHIEVSWQPTEVGRYILQWDFLWRRASPIEDFCESYDLTIPGSNEGISEND